MHKVGVVLLSSLLLVAAGCAVHEEKSGGADNVQISTPVGGMKIRTNATHAADLGLPLYPGAVQVAGDDGDSKSADVNMSFAGFHLHVQAVHFRSADPQNKVADFYRKAMVQYGGAVTCKDHKPVGQPEKTQLGLTCENEHTVHVKGNIEFGDDNDKKTGKSQKNADRTNLPLTGPNDFQLIAGSTANQHIVAFQPAQDGTDFALIVVQLPHAGQTD